MIEKLLERQRVAKAKAAQPDAQPAPKEASETPFSMYPASEPLTRDTKAEAEALPARVQEPVTRPARTFMDGGANRDQMYNALGLRSGPLSVLSTHRAPQSQQAIAARRQEQESRAWRGFEAMLNLFNPNR